MLGKQCLHVARTLCQTLGQKTDVLRDERRALRAILTDQTQKSLSDMPGELNSLGDARELDRLDQPCGAREREDFALCCFERVRILGADLDEQSGGLGIESLPVGGRLLKGLTGRSERRSNHQLDCGGPEADEARNKGNRFIDRGNWNPCHARHAWCWNRL